MIEDIENHVESKTTVLDALIMLDKAWRNVTSTGITNCFRHAGFCDVSTDTTQLLADSVLINDIDKDYVQVDDDFITSEIQTDEYIVNNGIASQQVESDNDTDIDELDNEFETVPSISEACASLRTLERFYYTKYEDTDTERKALFLLETSINSKHTKQSSIKDYFKKFKCFIIIFNKVLNLHL